jgi:hypothetical protein
MLSGNRFSGMVLPVINYLAPITLKILPEIRLSSKAKMYRYYQIDGVLATGDVNTIPLSEVT